MQIKIENVNIATTNEIKFLGLKIDNKLLGKDILIILYPD